VGGKGGAIKEEGLLGEVFRDMGEEDPSCVRISCSSPGVAWKTKFAGISSF
jgi:hypothetical protein